MQAVIFIWYSVKRIFDFFLNWVCVWSLRGKVGVKYGSNVGFLETGAFFNE